MHTFGVRIMAAALAVSIGAACPMAQRMENYDPARCRRDCSWVDENNDGVCDNLGYGFVDADGDGICDNRGENCAQSNGCGNAQGNSQGNGNGRGNGQGNQHGRNG